MVGWLVEFYGISTLACYFMPNPPYTHTYGQTDKESKNERERYYIYIYIYI